MASMIDTMAAKTEKHMKHLERVKQHENTRKRQMNAVDAEKAHLNKIGSLAQFGGDASLDTLYMHISNQIKN